MNEDETQSGTEDRDAEDFRARAEQAEAALAAIEREMHEKLARATLATEAVRAGMIDLDGLKFVEGAIADPAAAIGALKAAKPWLFGGRFSASTAAVPRPEPPRQKHAREMGFDEWRAARAALLRRY